MIESVRKAVVTLPVHWVNYTKEIFRCGNLGNVEIFQERHKRAYSHHRRTGGLEISERPDLAQQKLVRVLKWQSEGS